MACYMIVTCASMLWTLLTVLTSLVVLYCVTSPNWLVGYERSHQSTGTDMSTGVIQYINKTAEQEHHEITTAVSSYRPTIGLYSRCLSMRDDRGEFFTCASFVQLFGKDDSLFPLAWQAALVITGIAATLLVFVSVCSVLSLCMQDFCKKSIFTISGLIQVIAGIFLAIAEVLYPLGWSSERLNYFCGKQSDLFSIGECSLGWSYVVVIISTVCIFAVGMLSIQADRATSKDEIEDEILKGKHLICII